MKFSEWKLFKEFDAQKSIADSKKLIVEANTASRYSIEVNYRTSVDETLNGFAKICLGYVSAALKQNGYHIKYVYDEKPVRIIVSSRNWDDGEWTILIHYHPEHDGGSFIISKGFYNKDAKTVSVQSSKKCSGDSAAEIAKEARNALHEIKNKSDRNQPKLKGGPLKRGPKG
jgi:hypothetical protein